MLSFIGVSFTIVFNNLAPLYSGNLVFSSCLQNVVILESSSTQKINTSQSSLKKKQKLLSFYLEKLASSSISWKYYPLFRVQTFCSCSFTFISLPKLARTKKNSTLPYLPTITQRRSLCNMAYVSNLASSLYIIWYEDGITRQNGCVESMAKIPLIYFIIKFHNMWFPYYRLESSKQKIQ